MIQASFRYVTTNLYQSGSTPNPIIAELPFTNVNFTQQLNSIGTFQGSVLLSGINSANLNAYDGTIPGKTILWVLLNEVPVWSGVIWHREYDSESQILSITAQEMMSLYQRRRIATTKNYTTVPKDPCYIARDLMQYSEARSHGKTGMTYDSTLYGSTVSRTYNGYEYKSVYQAIKDLAQNYFDFAIYPDLPLAHSGQLVNKFVMGVPLGNTYSSTNYQGLVFSLPGNIVKYIFPEDGIAAANTLYGLGYGANNSKIVATYIDSNKIGSSGDWPLLEDVVNYMDISNPTLLAQVTLGNGNAISYPPTTLQVVLPTYADPNYGLYGIGDEARVYIQDDYFPSGLNLIMRIVAIDVSPGENGPDRVTVTLTRQLAAGSVS
jgi:hypothetical protein